MKVLLYEPGNAGHRPVILRYLMHGLPESGWEPIALTDPQFSRLRDEDIESLTRYALDRGCNAVHMLTIDGAAKRWIRPRRSMVCGSLPLFGNYYLYNNLWGSKGLAWLWAHWAGYFSHIFVSDPYIKGRQILPGLRSIVSYVPDPWSREEFPWVERRIARKRLDLPADDFLLLVFGQISARKGIKRILEAARGLSDSAVRVVVAGGIMPDARDDISRAKSDPLLKNRVIIHDGPIPENHVSSYFHACNAVLSDYPKSFLVSSGVFTRALAAGALPIVPSHGVNAEVVRKLGRGIIYEGESRASLSAAMRRAPYIESNWVSEEVRIRTRGEVEQREVGKYVKAIASMYDSLSRLMVC